MAAQHGASHLPLIQTRGVRPKFQLFFDSLDIFQEPIKPWPYIKTVNSPCKSIRLLNLSRLSRGAQINFNATILCTAGFGGVVSDRLGLTHA